MSPEDIKKKYGDAISGYSKPNKNITILIFRAKITKNCKNFNFTIPREMVNCSNCNCSNFDCSNRNCSNFDCYNRDCSTLFLEITTAQHKNTKNEPAQIRLTGYLNSFCFWEQTDNCSNCGCSNCECSNCDCSNCDCSTCAAEQSWTRATV